MAVTAVPIIPPPPGPAPEPPRWTIKDTEKLYNMKGWGLGYFRVNDDGHVTVHPDGSPGREIDLYNIAMDLSAQGVGLPLLLRFSDILKSRIAELAHRFATAIEDFGYEGTYTTVYPVKVNQQRHVVQEIVEFGAAHGVGLECGSKPELMAVLGQNESTRGLIVCNGYKDEEFMRLALIGQQLGHTVMIVLEQPNELDMRCSRSPAKWESTRRSACESSWRRKGRGGGRRAAARSRSSASPRWSWCVCSTSCRLRGRRTCSSWSTSISAARSPTSGS